ncbi:antiviral reverse transcriptase Drt3a [Flavobacterium sp.]|uniref:antiviral reverse transcriptase Drt3a n=1 Tax=Flavobacterium sp. TaxID=239 RepID=UPI002B5EAAE3|nr:antiviral reverse transcriptase Drt3a [Flavobacterium sp.]HSD08176.1 antiviral reverse transcriptase Drt3a [Flavobacterium sp.]
MLDQSFTSKTFLEIFDKENRKGKNIENRFKNDFAESLKDLSELQAINKNIRATRNINIKSILYQKRKVYKKERERKIISTLNNASFRIAKNKNAINLFEGQVYGKQSYHLENTIENFFISKKIQENIEAIYSVKPSSRFSILSELLNLLKDKFPKYVIRTDIASFYETIPQKEILNKINNDNLLSITTKRFINEVFISYNVLKGQENDENPLGIPRGIGFSAYLSELFMRKIDNEIKALKDVVYYGRYVDDIVVILVPNRKEDTVHDTYFSSVEKIIKDGGLALNEDKTVKYNLLNGLSYLEVNPIEFLGYKISSCKKAREFELSIDMSKRREDKYIDKIDKTFEVFKAASTEYNNRKTFKLLEARLNFLCCNTKLRNSKNRVFVGIYYSNIFLNNFNALERLDNHLINCIDGLEVEDKLKDKLRKNNFNIGFRLRKFILFPLNNMLYKSQNSKKRDFINNRNRGVLQYGLTEINSIWKY